jgi:hypothetical protein
MLDVHNVLSKSSIVEKIKGMFSRSYFSTCNAEFADYFEVIGAMGQGSNH